MAEIQRTALFGKLSPLGFRSLESATVFCKLRAHASVELAHWLHQILQEADSDLLRIVRHARLDSARLAADLGRALDRLPCASAGQIDLSPLLEQAMERAWVYASLLFAAAQVRSGHLLLALLKTPPLRRELLGLSPLFAEIDANSLGDEFESLLASSPEAKTAALPDNRCLPGEACGALPPPPAAQQALARYTVDLSAEARAGKLDPIVGRDAEIRQVIDILMRRRQNNPILTGEAGVGKTAVVEGLAQRIASGDVPPALRKVSLRTLDIGLLTAGASMKGEFEQRLRQVIDEVQHAAEPVILFIDEAHTLVGAGGTAGTGDAANLLKPALARGNLRTIAATTWAEYKKHIEKDPALTRRFQPVMVAEPEESSAIRMLRSLVPYLERHHGVEISEAALSAAVQLSQRYVPDRQLPDKAVCLLDTVCARVAVSQHATPPAVEQARALLAALDEEHGALTRALRHDPGMAQQLMRVEQKQAEAASQCAQLERRWLAEHECIQRLLALRTASSDAADPDGLRQATQQQQQSLEQLQGEEPLVLMHVDAAAVARVVQDWTGIPLGRMVRREIDQLLQLADTLKQRIIGQDTALEAIARRVQTSRAGLDLPNKPVGVFLLAGPSGVGKSETAKALADVLYGGERNLITVNMSEYQEAHTISTLKGAPPGYVGYGQGGVLTEAVRRRPYSVLLLDEVEKAHPDVHEIFYQVFDQGWMEDGEGRVIDFKNTLILLTSNSGAEEVCAAAPEPAAMRAALARPLARVFPPALLGRMTVIPYAPLTRDTLACIIRLQLEQIATRLAAQQIVFDYSDTVVDALLAACAEEQSGARQVQALLMQQLMPEIGQAILQGKRNDQPLGRVRVRAGADGWHFDFTALEAQA